jgi:F0F1-type ATP synthase membrane subunit b/b'
MVNVANRTISNYIETLEESDKKELINLLSSDIADLEKEFEQIKEDVVKKLTTLKESVEDDETKTKVDETLEKINSEKFDKLSYFKLKNLKETL